MRGNIGHDLLVAVQTRLLSYFQIACLDPDGIREFARGKGEGVPKAIVGLHPVFSQEVVGSVTVITGGDGTVTGLNPSVIVVVHDVAVGTCFWIVGQVRSPFCVYEGKRANSTGDTHRAPNNNPFYRARFHPTRRQ